MLRNEDYIYKGDTFIYIKDDIEYRRSVLIKEPAEDHPPSHEIDALNNEYEIIRSLNIDGVRKALKKELNQGRPVLTLEYIEGETLEDYVRTAQPEINDKLEIAIKLANTLWELHQRNIIYNDLNSRNILVTKCDRSVVIIDFGSAVRDNTVEQNEKDIKYRKELCPIYLPNKQGG